MTANFSEEGARGGLWLCSCYSLVSAQKVGKVGNLRDAAVESAIDGQDRCLPEGDVSDRRPLKAVVTTNRGQTKLKEGLLTNINVLPNSQRADTPYY